MAPIDPATVYADSPDRMLYLSILLLFAVALLVLASKRWGPDKRSTYVPPPSVDLAAVRKSPSEDLRPSAS